MIYEYECPGCEKHFDVTKGVDLFRREEHCPTSGTTMVQCFSRTQLFNTAVQEAYYSPAFGEVVKGHNHARQMAKDRGWIEVGNERPEKHLKPQRVEYE